MNTREIDELSGEELTAFAQEVGINQKLYEGNGPLDPEELYAAMTAMRNFLVARFVEAHADDKTLNTRFENNLRQVESGNSGVVAEKTLTAHKALTEWSQMNIDVRLDTKGCQIINTTITDYKLVSDGPRRGFADSQAKTLGLNLNPESDFYGISIISGTKRISSYVGNPNAEGRDKVAVRTALGVIYSVHNGLNRAKTTRAR